MSFYLCVDGDSYASLVTRPLRGTIQIQHAAPIKQPRTPMLIPAGQPKRSLIHGVITGASAPPAFPPVLRMAAATPPQGRTVHQTIGQRAAGRRHPVSRHAGAGGMQRRREEAHHGADEDERQQNLAPNDKSEADRAGQCGKASRSQSHEDQRRPRPKAVDEESAGRHANCVDDQKGGIDPPHPRR